MILLGGNPLLASVSLLAWDNRWSDSLSLAPTRQFASAIHYFPPEKIQSMQMCTNKNLRRRILARKKLCRHEVPKPFCVTESDESRFLHDTISRLILNVGDLTRSYLRIVYA